jgi:Mn2+/Fe2+ NRAMP family transporter
VFGAGIVLIPNVPLVKMILFSQVLSGALLPFVLIFMILLINKQALMGEWVNSRTYNIVAWLSVVIMIGLTLALVGITARDLWGVSR